MHMVKHSRLCGRAIVAYLQSKGFPEVALHFVREPQTRFRLALACGDIEAAMESAFALEQQSESGADVWGQLGSEALRQGNPIVPTHLLLILIVAPEQMCGDNWVARPFARATIKLLK